MSEVKENVFLFVPNIIGFSRVILGIISLYYMPHNYMLAMVYYVISGLLDAVDGHAARYFNQSTKFGSLLDQVTDRVMTMCLLMQLSNFYPNYALFFQISNMIDIGGHWIYFFGSTIKGKSSHKSIDLNENCVLRLYYTSRTVLFTMCAANELFYVSLYLLHFTEGPYSEYTQIIINHNNCDANNYSTTY